jgi:hypothetical protein
LQIQKDNWLFLAFKSVLSDPAKISENVDRLKREMNENQVAQYLIRRKSRAVGMIGGATALPGVVPFIGAIGTIATALSSELIAVAKLEIELCMEIAHLCGRDISKKTRIYEILAIMAAHGRKPAAKRELTNRMTKKAAKTGLLRLSRGVSRRIVRKRLNRILFKVVPWIGIPISAAYNLNSTRKIGYAALDYYSNIGIPKNSDTTIRGCRGKNLLSPTG